jgi:hypothetical protein
MSKWSSRFLEIWSNQNNSLDIEEYEFCRKEFQDGHDKRCAPKYVATILLFGLGLWALHEGAITLAVLMLALAANFNLISAHHILMSEIICAQRLLAMLIHKQSQDMETLRMEIRKES